MKTKKKKELADFEAIQSLSQDNNFNNNQNYVLLKKHKKFMGEYINEFNARDSMVKLSLEFGFVEFKRLNFFNSMKNKLKLFLYYALLIIIMPISIYMLIIESTLENFITFMFYSGGAYILFLKSPEFKSKNYSFFRIKDRIFYIKKSFLKK